MSIKPLLSSIGYIVAFLISSVIILAALVDANMFKPRIQAMAAQQGIALTLRGNVRWAFWPAIGLAVNEVSIADSDAPHRIIANINKASFLIAFIPLMRGDFQVKHILVDAAIIAMEVDAQGTGNWEKLIKKKATVAADNTTQNTTDDSAENLTFSIEKISVHNSQITYTNVASGQKLALKKITLTMADVNLKGNPFELDFSSEIELSHAKTTTTPIIVKSKLHSSLIMGEGLNTLTFTDSELSLDIHAAASANMTLQYSLTLEDVKNNLHYQGKVAMAAMNLKQLLAALGAPYTTTHEQALTHVSLNGEFQGDKKRVTFTHANLQIDKTHLQGSLALNDFTNPAIMVNVHGDELKVDDYLAPTANENIPIAANTAASTAAGSATDHTANNAPLRPQEPLRKLNADIKLGFNTLSVLDLRLEKVLLTINAKNGVLQQQLDAHAYAGNIHQTTELDVRGQAPRMQFDVMLQGVEIAPILQAKKLDKNLHLSGAINANARGQATGASKTQLMTKLIGNATFSGAKIRLEPLNIEQQFCKLVALVNRADVPVQTWNAYTGLRELSGKLAIANGIITIEHFNAGVEKLLLSSTGHINLLNGGYDFTLPLTLVRDADDTATSITTSAQGCTITSNYWAERSMSLLRCKGVYANINPTQDCRPDKDMLNAVITEFAHYTLREKYGAKADAKKTELKQKLEEKLGDGGADKAKNLLKNLFKKKEEKTQ